MTELTQLEQALEATSIGKWKAYPSYKDSGVEWLGEIPEHWEVWRLKYAAPISTSKLDEKPPDALYIGLENIESKTGRLLLDTPIENVDSAVGVFEKGNVLFGKLRPYLAKVACVGFSGVCTTELLVLQPAIFVSAKFLYYRLLSDDFIQLVNSMTYGTKMPRASGEQIGNLPIHLPSISEQRAITAFLDRETARIKSLIAKKECLIELLQEKRTALISHAVTKGLDSDVKMKVSGVEWLGEIPAHWEILQLRRIVKTFVDYRGFTPTKTPHGIPLITARNIRNGTLDFTNSQEFISEEDYDTRMVRGLPKSGDILITTEAPLGETAQIEDENVTLAQRIILLKVDKFRMTNDYLKYYFMSAAGQGELWSRATGSTAIGIKASHLREILIAVPPLNQQHIIITYLNQETAGIDALISKIGEAIEKLKEYSTALISAAVTGKIDVRGEVAIVGETEFGN